MRNNMQKRPEKLPKVPGYEGLAYTKRTSVKKPKAVKDPSNGTKPGGTSMAPSAQALSTTQSTGNKKTTMRAVKDKSTSNGEPIVRKEVSKEKQASDGNVQMERNVSGSQMSGRGTQTITLWYSWHCSNTIKVLLLMLFQGTAILAKGASGLSKPAMHGSGGKAVQKAAVGEFGRREKSIEASPRDGTHRPAGIDAIVAHGKPKVLASAHAAQKPQQSSNVNGLKLTYLQRKSLGMLKPIRTPSRAGAAQKQLGTLIVNNHNYGGDRDLQSISLVIILDIAGR